ncbi:MAG: biliverdin-producing heme oxygenase [Pseudomonadota bacterium]
MRPLRHHLRQETEAAHLALHRHPGFAAIESGEIVPQDHDQLMARVGGFYAILDPLASAASKVLGDHLAGYRYRPRAALFPNKAEKQIHVPDLATPAELAGAVYVVDGAVLGGQILARAFGDQALHPYWQWCCHHGPAVWRTTKALLEHVDTDTAARDEATETALRVFKAFSEAIDGAFDKAEV